MPYRPATVVQADIARVIRAFRAAGIENVRVRLTADGPVVEPGIAPDASTAPVAPLEEADEEVLIVPLPSSSPQKRKP